MNKILIAALLAALAAGAWQTHRLAKEEGAHARTDRDFSTYREQAERAAREASEKHRATEQELHDAQAAHATLVQSLESDLDRARRAAADSAGGMRNAIAAATARARTQCADTTAAAVRQATGDAIGVLADVLGRADARAELLADVADRRGIAGRACEREHDTAREALIKGESHVRTDDPAAVH